MRTLLRGRRLARARRRQECHRHLRSPTWRIIRPSTCKRPRRRPPTPTSSSSRIPGSIRSSRTCCARDPQLVVYDSQNVEGLLRLRLLGDTPFGRADRDARGRLERELCRAAESRARLLARRSRGCSTSFTTSRSASAWWCRTARSPRPSCRPLRGERAAAKQRARAGRRTARGLRRQPLPAQRRSGATSSTTRWRRALPAVTFVICGGVGDAFDEDGDSPPNVRITLR